MRGREQSGYCSTKISLWVKGLLLGGLAAPAVGGILFVLATGSSPWPWEDLRGFVTVVAYSAGLGIVYTGLYGVLAAMLLVRQALGWIAEERMTHRALVGRGVVIGAGLGALATIWIALMLHTRDIFSSSLSWVSQLMGYSFFYVPFSIPTGAIGGGLLMWGLRKELNELRALKSVGRSSEYGH